MTPLRVLAARLVLVAALLSALPVASAPAAAGDESDPSLRVRGGRVGDRVVFRIGVRAPKVAPGAQPAILFLRTTRPVRFRCRGNGCPAAGAQARSFTVSLVGPGRVLVTAAGGTRADVVLDASVLLDGAPLATETLRAPALASPTRAAGGGSGTGTKIALALAAIVAAALAVLASRWARRREDDETVAAAPEAAPEEDDANLWELAAAARARPPADPRRAAELEALLFELRQHAGIDGRIPGHLAALVRQHNGSAPGYARGEAHH